MRVALGLTMSGRGARKLFNSFGAAGSLVTGEGFQKLGFQLPALAAFWNLNARARR
jgi:hypothetical protein